MKSNIVFFILVALISPASVLGQKLTEEKVIEDPKWEIGTDLLWLIDKNTLPKYTLLVRRKIGKNGSLRIRGGYLKNSNYLAFQQRDYNTASLIRLGYERQKPLTAINGFTKSLIYGGIDLFIRYENNSYELYNITNPLPFIGTGISTKDVTHERGGALFIGYKYFVGKSLSLSLESSFQASHVDYSQEERGFNSGYYAYNERPRSSYQFLPINTITFSFHF